MTNGQQKQKDEYTKKEGYKEIYVTDMRGAVNFFDFRMTLFNSDIDLDKSNTEEIVINHKAEAEVIMSHTTLKQLANWLVQKVNDLSKIHEEIEKQTEKQNQKKAENQTYIR